MVDLCACCLHSFGVGSFLAWFLGCSAYRWDRTWMDRRIKSRFVHSKILPSLSLSTWVFNSTARNCAKYTTQCNPCTKRQPSKPINQDHPHPKSAHQNHHLKSHEQPPE